MIRNVSLFDGEQLVPASTVVVAGGKIRSVGRNLPIPAGAQVIEGAGHTLLPGFIDSHAHVWDASQLEQSAIFGVTTVLDMGCGMPTVGLQLRRSAATQRGHADLRFAGYAVTAPKGHCTEYGFPVPTITRAEDAAAFVEARVKEGSDYIKLVYDDGKSFGFQAPTISKATLGAAIEAAHARRKLAIVHISTLQAARDALAAGADGLAHMFVDQGPDPEFGSFAAAHHAFVIATLSVSLSTTGMSPGQALLRDPQLAGFIPQNALMNLKRSFPTRPGAAVKYEAAEAGVRQLKASRVPVLAGTDAPNPGTTYGATIHGELELLTRAGLTPAEALTAATAAPAAQFHLNDRGRIAPRLRADLVLVKGDPTKAITATREIVSIWKGGERIERETYLARVEAEKAAQKRQAQAPGPAGSESGLVSDFDDGKLSTRFGHGWAVSTDQLMGGKSTAELKVVPSGANGSKASLLITGEIVAGAPFPWAGAMFSPGPMPGQPANLSAKKQVAFWAKGDGKAYSVLLFSQSRGYQPARARFDTSRDWKQYVFALEKFDGIDGHDLTGVFFGGGDEKGRFSFQIDNVEIR